MEISLALGGGGMKGAAHIGVLRKLEKEGFTIKAVAGTSAGGIIAAMYAAGIKPAELLKYFSELDQSTVFGRRPHDNPSLLGVSGIIALLEETIGEISFKDLKISCAVTAVDLKSGVEIILAKGKVIDAVLATIALPGVFPTQNWGPYELVDGGVYDPVPVQAARMLAPNLPVVAVVLTAPPDKPVHASISPDYLGPEPIIRQIARLRIAQSISTFVQAVDIGQRLITELRLEIDQPDVILRPQIHHVGLLERVDVGKLSWLGDQAVEQALPELRKANNLSNRVWRFLAGRKRFAKEERENGA